ncbi:MAG: CinA family nicotinamide mononucleotide deamidase-related protein [Candidatus Marinimicrobia bacterium]|nr:CinA family nicotinamide mononucleotide deamidase-related protein [Candidatus Neomarinimicrobiota bacterium]
MVNASAEIINIGDELLAGHTVNANAAWISRSLRSAGIAVSRHIVIPDEKNAIIYALDHLLDTTSYVFITGGLGPTGDDRTKAVISAYFGGDLVFMPEIYKKVEEFFRARGRTPSPANREQAYQPDNAELVPNSRGTASGMIFRKERRTYYVMPGVPFEMQSMMTDSILPKLTGGTGVRDVELQINTFGIPESELADMITEHFPGIEKDIILGYYPSLRGITLRLRSHKMKTLEAWHKKIRSLLGDAVYAVNGGSLASCVVRMCREKQISLASAESCTGGLIGDMITDIPGASDIYKQGYIVYSNEAKNQLLGVDPGLIKKYGAVSRECVTAMAEGLRKVSNCDIAVAVSGIAGPSGGSSEKPVGTVWIAVFYKTKITANKLSFDRGRRNNKEFSANTALNAVRLAMIREQINKETYST